MRNYYIFIVIVWVLVIFLTLMTTGSPIIKKKQVDDQKLVVKMIDLSDTIDTYYRIHKRLPEDLEEISKQGIYIDLANFEPQIDYKVGVGYQFQLCAEFLTDTTDITYEDSYRGIMSHKKGYDCIDFEVSNFSRNYNSDVSGIVSPTPVPSVTPYISESVSFYVQGEYDNTGTNKSMKAELLDDMTIKYSKDENNGGKAIIYTDNEPLLEFKVIVKHKPIHFLSYEKLNGTISGEDRYLVSTALSSKDEVKYYYTDVVSVLKNCSNDEGPVRWPCGPVNVQGIAIQFIGDMEDLEIANNVVASLKFL